MSIEKLLINHAYWSDRIRELKELSSQAISDCTRLREMTESTESLVFDGWTGRPTPHNCIEYVYSSWSSGFDPVYENITFEEVWADAVVEGDVCQSCQDVRRYKTERISARRRLGAIRAAITRVGRRLAKEKA